MSKGKAANGMQVRGLDGRLGPGSLCWRSHLRPASAGGPLARRSLAFTAASRASGAGRRPRGPLARNVSGAGVGRRRRDVDIVARMGMGMSDGSLRPVCALRSALRVWAFASFLAPLHHFHFPDWVRSTMAMSTVKKINKNAKKTRKEKKWKGNF